MLLESGCGWFADPPANALIFLYFQHLVTPSLQSTIRNGRSRPGMLKNCRLIITFCLQPCLSGGGDTGERGDPKNDEKIKVHRMGLPRVENLSGLQESIFSLFRSPNAILVKRIRMTDFQLILLTSLYFSCLPTLGQWLFGVLCSVCWGHPPYWRPRLPSTSQPAARNTW